MTGIASRKRIRQILVMAFFIEFLQFELVRATVKS